MWRWLLLLPTALIATQLQPWFPEMLRIWTYGRYAFETYPRVDRGPQQSSYLHRAQVGLLVAPLESISSELDLSLAGGRNASFFFDFGRITLRYLILNDILGDPISLTVGGSATFSSLNSRRNFATPHLGSIDWALHSAAGKEWSCEQWWVWRVWAVGQAALSSQGAPQLWGQIALERNFWDDWQIGLHGEGIFNFGKRQIFEVPNFRGYGPIQTRAASVGAWLTVRLSVYGHLRLDYCYRPYSRNYPESDHYAALTYWYPLSL